MPASVADSRGGVDRQRGVPPGRRAGSRNGGLLIVVGTVHGSPRFSSAFLHPRYWPLWFGLGLLWLVVQLPYPVLLMLGRGLGALMYRLVGSRRRNLPRATSGTLCWKSRPPNASDLC